MTRECEVCGRSGRPAERCTLERQCLCWHGYPCGRESSGRDSWTRTARVQRAAARLAAAAR